MQAMVAWLAAQYIRLVYATSRTTVIGGEHISHVRDADQPVIGCFWHGRMLMARKIWTDPAPMHLLISTHQDGQLISRVIAHFGVRTIAGSSSRGAVQALRVMARTLAAGGSVSVTPDGPRGPRMRAAAGIAMTAKLTGAPIVPVSYSSSRAVSFSSWDRFLLALPFGRLVFIVGEPIRVTADADGAAIEAARALVELRLNQLTHEADRLCGRKPVEPAPASNQFATDPT